MLQIISSEIRSKSPSSLPVNVWQSYFYLQCVADLEAFIDFSEDQDLEEEIVTHGNTVS